MAKNNEWLKYVSVIIVALLVGWFANAGLTEPKVVEKQVDVIKEVPVVKEVPVDKIVEGPADL